MSEKQLQDAIRLALSNVTAARIWRNNVGQAMTEHGGVIRFGLCPGSADLIGYKSVTITPEMVGQKVAIFTGIEIKLPGKKPTKEQAQWLKVVAEMGGITGVARSVEDAVNLVNGTGIGGTINSTGK